MKNGVAVSVLSDPPRAWDESPGEPDFFRDLNLDQVVQSVTLLKSDYNLLPYYHVPVNSVEAVGWRHEVLHDLEQPDVRRAVDAFAEGMRSMRDELASAAKMHYPRQRQSWILDATRTYRDTIRTFAAALPESRPRSRALTRLAVHLSDFTSASDFTSLSDEVNRITENLANVRYCLHLLGNHITVDSYDGQDDYSAQILGVFDRFKRAEATEYRSKLRAQAEMNHVEAALLDKVAMLNPELFSALAAFTGGSADHLDPTVVRFDREIQFFLAWLDHVGPMRESGLPFCYPAVSTASKKVVACETFDVALAAKLSGENAKVVTNGFRLDPPERVIVVTGPNQGGKTTTARTFGQLHYLARLGLLAPGVEVHLPLCDRIFTHFERGENLSDLSGKLQDDLVRIHAILDKATPRSVVIMNEIFTSTTLRDAIALGSRVLERVLDLGCVAVWVTFIDELARLDDAVVSMASTVDSDNPAVRTYKVVRHSADGLAYANAIARKYGLTYDRLTQRVAS